MNVLVTGSNGFVGRNLCAALGTRPHVRIIGYDLGSQPAELDRALEEAEVIYHLAGVNRPQRVEEYQAGNAGFTDEICTKLALLGRRPKIVLSSSIQAELNNPYGASKREAENRLQEYGQQPGAAAVVYRFKNLFGKWCRPNYNSVTATFCYNIARGLPIQVSHPAHVLDLTYIDDVVEALLAQLGPATIERSGFHMADELPSHRITLQDLARLIQTFRDHRKTLMVPDFSSRFIRALYATYLSYLEPDDFAYSLDLKIDARGSLAEFVKQPHFGQIFVSRTKPGITRGNHYHHTKTEKFMVVEGEALIRFRSILSKVQSGKGEGPTTENTGLGTGANQAPETGETGIVNLEQIASNSQLQTPHAEIMQHRVSGCDFRVVDIPPGYTHSIENVGQTDMVVLFWASEVFDPSRSDTYPMAVEQPV
jgi:UDP-2-acetamido-2,6-beta-L-arabino-hexul-4-ose reductase